MDQSQQKDQAQEAVHHCHWHPGVETGLWCSRCGKHICTQCMVQAPVGIRCRECGRTVRTPTYDVRPTYYARAGGVGIVIAIGGGLIWALFNAILGGIPLLPSLMAIGVGYGAGEILSLAVNRKRGSGLAWIAAGSVVGAFLVSWLVHPFSLWSFGLLFVVMGVYAAVQRVR
ncbi:MAG: hypothetical protein AAB528_02400 [Chloroflexota bacterium]